jgi:GTP:adenosylcobinamide-phosphate guanylyltransferase
MDAIVTAGGIPQPDDPLYPFSHGDSKALVDVAGKPMVQWVLDALGNAKQVDNVIIIGLSPRSGLTCVKPLHYVSNQGRMLANIVAGVNKTLELDAETQYVLVVSSDIPTLKGEMVDWLINTCMQTQDDLYYGVCPRDVMEKRFPASKRSYTRLKDIDLCGADINITHVRMATEHLELWEQLIGNRKNSLRQAALIGLDTFYQVATHSITLNDLVEKVSKRIGIKGRAIVWSYAEPCMDVDKPHQLELVRADLARQQRKAAAPAKKAAKKKITKKVAKKSKQIKTVRAKPVKKTAKAKPARKAIRPKAKARKALKPKPKTRKKARAR